MPAGSSIVPHSLTSALGSGETLMISNINRKYLTIWRVNCGQVMEKFYVFQIGIWKTFKYLFYQWNDMNWVNVKKIWNTHALWILIRRLSVSLHTYELCIVNMNNNILIAGWNFYDRCWLDRDDVWYPGLIVITWARLAWSSLPSLQIIWPTSHLSLHQWSVKHCPRQVSCLYEGQSVPLFYFQVQCQGLAGFIVCNFSYFPVSSTLSVVTIKHFWQVTTSHWNTGQLNDAWHQGDSP